MLQLGLASTDDAETSSESARAAGTAPDSLPGTFGAYRPIGVLGEGGMGIVYLADQEQPIRRRVALKVIKQGMDTRHVIARFESERQALALMDHPNIAQVYEAGATPEGRPYFVMEYVPGTPITDYCDKHLLGLRDRLELFIQVCHAVHHAHQKGVIHRDIKPSNVLVTIRDGRPVPKVIDFGVAKATHQRLTEKSLFTELGVLIGTPAYMSPEQAEMTGLDVDTATDIYSLGVVLYELLVGALPFDPQALRKAGYDEIRRMIREDEPPRPTAKLHGLGPTATAIARRRHMDVRSLERFLNGDLDWITMKALEKDRTRRYASASEFAADITRHLRDEVVVARPPSLVYRMSRFALKHRGAVASATALFLILAVGFAVSTVFFFRSETARREAERQRETARRHGDLATIAAAESEAARQEAERQREAARRQGNLATAAADESEAARREAEQQRETARRQGYLATIAAADINLHSGAASEAKRRLKLIDPALRGWEWRHLYSQADESIAAVGAKGAVTFVTFSPDESRVLWLTQYGVVHVADAHTQRSIPSLTRPLGPRSSASQPAYILAISPDGSRLLSSAWKPLGGPRTLRGADPRGFGIGAQHRPLSKDETNALSLTDAVQGTLLRSFLVPDTGVWIWPSDVNIREHSPFRITARAEIRDAKDVPIFTMSGGGEPVSAGFSSDGRRLATWAWDNVLRVWDVESGAAVAAFAGHKNGISSAAFSPDGTRVVSGSYDGTARIWTLGGTTTVLAGHDGSVNAVAFAPDGLHVASAGSDKVVRVWDVAGHALATLKGHDRRVTTLAFAPNGHELASGSEDQTIRLWDAETFQPRAALYGHTDTITSITFTADGRRLVSGSADQTLRFWEPDVRRSGGIITTTGGDVWQVAVSGDSSHLAVAQHDGAVRILNLSAMTPPVICTRRPFPNFLRHKNIAFVDGTRLVSTYSGAIRVWDGSNCSVLAAWNDEGRYEAQELAMSPDGSRVATASWGGRLEIQDTSGRSIWQADQAGRVRALTFSRDGARVIVAAGRNLRVWNADRAAGLTMIGHEDDVTAVAVSQDGRWIASGSNDRTVRLWNAATGLLTATLTGHDANVNAVAFSPDSTRLVSGGDDHALRLWDVATRAQILVLQGHQGGVTAVAFTPDGSRIVSGSADGTVRVWDSRLTRDPNAESRDDVPSALNDQSWRTAKTAGLPSTAYELALRRALLANEAAPWDGDFVRTLGATYYRMRRYDDSLAMLTWAASLRSELVAEDWLFIAMAHHQLRHGAEAREALTRVRAILATTNGRRQLATDVTLKALDDEATALIGR